MKKLLFIFCATVMVGCSNDEFIDSVSEEFDEDGKQIVDKLGQYMIPKCLDEKAQIIRVELKAVR